MTRSAYTLYRVQAINRETKAVTMAWKVLLTLSDAQRTCGAFNRAQVQPSKLDYQFVVG